MMDKETVPQASAGQKLRSLILGGLLTALVFIATMAIHIPTGVGGVIHLGDSMVFLAAIVFGWKYGAVAGGIGMFLFDILSPYAVWAPYTLVIKGVMGLLVGKMAYAAGRGGQSLGWNIAGIVLGGIWMIAGYYVAEWMIYGNALAPVASIPGNVVQLVGGAVIALPLAAALQRTRLFK